MTPRHASNQGNNPNKRIIKQVEMDFPGGLLVKHLPANAGTWAQFPSPGRFHML